MHDRILSKNVTIAGRRVTHERYIRTNRGDSGDPPTVQEAEKLRNLH